MRSLRAKNKVDGHVAATFQDPTAKPQAVEVTFGLKLNAEAWALIAKTGIEGSVNVKLTRKSS